MSFGGNGRKRNQEAPARNIGICMEGKIAIIGDGDSITVFKAAGVATFAAENEAKAKELLRKVAKDYKIIFLTEELARPFSAFLKMFDE